MTELILRPVAAIFSVVPPFIFIAYFFSVLRVPFRHELIWRGVAIGAGFGFLAAISSYVLEALSPESLSVVEKNLLKAFLQVALPEELVKLIAFLLIGQLTLRYERVSTYLMLGAACSLGFAALENLFYIIESSDWDEVGYSRAVSAVPGHAFTGVIMGWSIYRFRKCKPVEIWLISLFIPVFLHGSYDFPLFMLSEADSEFSGGVSKQAYLWLFIVVVLLEAIIAHLCVFNLCGRETGPKRGMAFPFRHAGFWCIVGAGYLSMSIWFLYQAGLSYSHQKTGFTPAFQYLSGFSLFAFLHSLLFLVLAIRYFKASR